MHGKSKKIISLFLIGFLLYQQPIHAATWMFTSVVNKKPTLLDVIVRVVPVVGVGVVTIGLIINLIRPTSTNHSDDQPPDNPPTDDQQQLPPLGPIHPSDIPNVPLNQPLNVPYYIESKNLPAILSQIKQTIAQNRLRDEDRLHLLKQYQCYHHKEFRELLKTFPEYEKHIADLLEKLKSDRPFRNEMNEKYGQYVKLFFGKDSKLDFYNVIDSIATELDNIRINDRIAQQYADRTNNQELPFLQQRYQQEIQNQEVLPYASYARLRKERMQAISEYAKNQRGMFRESKISDDVQQILNAHGINPNLYSHSFGDHLQQHIHQETIGILSRLATLRYQHPADQKLQQLTSKLVYLADHTRTLKDNGQLVEAINFSDFCWAVVDSASAIVEGAAQGVGNMVHTVIHPIETLQNMCDITYSCIAFIYDVERAERKFMINPREGIKDLIALHDSSVIFFSNIKKCFDDMSRHERIKAGASIATEFFLPSKVFHLVGKTAGILKEKAADLVLQFKELMPAKELLVVAEGGQGEILKITEDFLLRASESLVGGNLKNPDIQKIQELLKGNRFYDDLITLEQKAAGYIKNGHPNLFKGENIILPSEHVLGLHFGKFLNSQGILVDGFQGFHHDLGRIIQKSGIMRFEGIIEAASGIYKADINWYGKLYKNKTFFPWWWSREQVILKIKEAYEYCVSNNVIPRFEEMNKVWVLNGITTEGIEVRMVINEHGKMITAYPDKNQFKIKGSVK